MFPQIPEKLLSLEPFAVGFMTSPTDDVEYRIARGMNYVFSYLPIDITPGRLFAATPDTFSRTGVAYAFGDCLTVSDGFLKSEIAKYPEYENELYEILDTMGPWDSYSIFNSTKTEEEKKITNAGWGGDWFGHANPDYDFLLHEGSAGIRRKIEKYRAINTGNDTFYDALTLVLDGLDTLGRRYGALAREKAETAEGEVRARYLRIAKAFEQIPVNPPRDFFEACQFFWLAFSWQGIDSPGRFDQFMIDYWRLSEENDREMCLDAMWRLFKETRTWNLCISGSDAEWHDETNELSYAILALVKKYRYNTPNLTMRVHRNTPERLWRAAAEAIGAGTGLPAIYNDEVVCPALEELGIPAEDAHEYCLNGCNQIDIFGKSHMGLEDGEVSLAKCLSLVFHRGVDDLIDTKIGADVGNPADCRTFEEFFALYKKEVEFICDRMTTLANKSQRTAAEFAPNPYRSLLTMGCIEKARDYKNGGPLYGHGQILAEGVADTVDSLAAVKHFIFDTKKYTMTELTDALSANFEGYDELYRDFSTYQKFGNDNDEVDSIFAEVTEHFNRYLRTRATYRGGFFGGGCSPFKRAARYGRGVSALPNGKKKGSSMLADSIGAVPGCDKNGPTALINSVCRENQLLCVSGNVLNLKFNKSIFTSETGVNAFLATVKTYFKKGGQQVSVCVVSREELLDAQIHPELHGDLIVSVGGYSDYFTALEGGLQENIIARTDIDL